MNTVMQRKSVYAKNGTALDLYDDVVVVMQRVTPRNWTVSAHRGGVTYQSTGNTGLERVAEAKRLVALHLPQKHPREGPKDGGRRQEGVGQAPR